jgi:hypothetical protein
MCYSTEVHVMEMLAYDYPQSLVEHLFTLDVPAGALERWRDESIDWCDLLILAEMWILKRLVSLGQCFSPLDN